MMTPNSKCLWTILLTAVISLLSEKLCLADSTFAGAQTFPNGNQLTDDKLVSNNELKRAWSKFASWGKRGFENSFSVWGKRGDDNEVAQIEPDKRAWSKFASWGKRDMPMESDKREWSGFHSWGKRDDDTLTLDDRLPGIRPIDLHDADKRKWSPLSTWGKRNYDDFTDAEKRKWSKFASWGKRADELSDMDKKKWSKFTSWGKRSETSDDASDENDTLSEDKRKWSKFASWGKRDDESMDKRKWSQLSTWGKRNGLSGDDLNTDKRAWSKFASWGKRYRTQQPWVNLGAWGKRRWTGLATWGKRSTDPDSKYMDVDQAAYRLMKYFDMNGDGALDLDEISTYIRTLMSLPSRKDMGEKEPEMTQQ
ncbi:prothoracicostatic peptides-like [Mya arenaria]|uniref:prothoracicostatic peptides-like n=1 Tax=Mya arenaria TaxID=6604 RepID=UPI0022E56E01|nr:prothoracicostatic peptides-like [Mya arenaria]